MKKLLLTCLLSLYAGFVAHAQSYPTDTIVTAANAEETKSLLISQVYGQCGCIPTGASTSTGSGSFNGYTYVTLASGAKFFDTDSDRLLIYHAGHSQDALATAGSLITLALGLDWDVLAINMPAEPHSQYANDEQPLKRFMNPVTLSLNYVLQNRTYESITMAGLSGGGWTTVLYTALDERITKSVPVAGSWPKYLRYQPGHQNSIGDYEQELPGLTLDYLDLYALAMLGGREQIQIFNSGDPCCFGGNSALDYDDEMQDAATALGGTYTTIIATNNQHSVHPSVYEQIVGPGAPEPPPAPPVLTAVWELNETSGTVLQETGGEFNGTFYNGPTMGVAALAGGTGTAITFDGVNDHARVPDHVSLRPGTGEYSIEMWAKWTSTNYGMAFGKFALWAPYTGQTVFFNHANNSTVSTPGKVSLRDRSESGYFVHSASGGLNDNVARHYVFQRRQTSPGVWQLEIYINGVLDASTTLPTVTDLSTTEQIYLFSRTDASQVIAGTFDKVTYRVGGALTPTEVLDHFQNP